MAIIANPHVIPPLRPNLSRYIKFNKTPYTIFRTLTYEALAQETFTGRVLDIGGGETASYRNLFKLEGTYESVNFAESMKSTYVADIEQPLPIEDAKYDTVISLNTFEHIYNVDQALSEAARVLKPDGRVFIQVPFLFRVHGSPNDFNRKTHSWWSRKLEELGFDKDTITIEPLIWDVRSLGFSICERYKTPFIPHRVRRAWALLPGLIKSVTQTKGSNDNRISQEEAQVWQDYALGYVMRAKKKQ